MIETAVVFDVEGKVIHWHEPPNRSGGALPDSSDLWDVLWENRDRLGGVAHTHPWDGPTGPSQTDLTTFDAVERALGRQLIWPVVSFTHVTFVVRNPLYGPGSGITHRWTQADPKYVTIALDWLDELRARSGAQTSTPAE